MDTQRLLELVKANNLKQVVDLLVASEGTKRTDQNVTHAVTLAIQNNLIEMLVALLVYQPVLNVKNKNGDSPLGTAVESKNKGLVQFLCDVGAIIDMTEWELPLLNIKTAKGQDKEFLEKIKTQNTLSTDRIYDKIRSKVFHVTGRTYSHFDLDMTFSESDFFFFLARFSPERSIVSSFKDYRQRVLCDVIHVKCWNVSPLKTKMIIKNIPGKLKYNEQVMVLTLEGKGMVDLVKTNTVQIRSGGLKETELTVDVTQQKDEDFKFIAIAVELPEMFSLSRSKTIIKSNTEPGFSVDIPEDTFASDKKLRVDVCETEDWKGDDDNLQSSVIKVTVEGGKQPKKPVTITMPLRAAQDAKDSINIFTSSKPVPSPNDWEKEDPTIVELKKNTAVFKTRKCAWMVAGKDEEKTKELASKAIIRQRSIKVYAMTKKEEDDEFTLLLEFANKQQASDRIKMWQGKGFLEESSVECDLQDNRCYKVRFSETLNVDEGLNDLWRFIPSPKDSFVYRLLRLVGVQAPSGYIIIEEPLQDAEQKEFDANLETTKQAINKSIKNKTHSKPQVQIKFSEILKLPIGMKEEFPTIKGLKDRRPGLVISRIEAAQAPVECGSMKLEDITDTLDDGRTSRLEAAQAPVDHRLNRGKDENKKKN